MVARARPHRSGRPVRPWSSYWAKARSAMASSRAWSAGDHGLVGAIRSGRGSRSWGAMKSSRMAWTSVPLRLGSMVKMASGRSRTSMRRTRSIRYRLGHSAYVSRLVGDRAPASTGEGTSPADPAVEAGEPIEVAGPPDPESRPEDRLEVGQVVAGDPVPGVTPGQELSKVPVGQGHRLAAGPDRLGERGDDLVAVEGRQVFQVSTEQAAVATLEDSERIEQPAGRPLLASPALVPAGIGQDPVGSGRKGGEVVASIVVGPAASKRDVRSGRAPLDVGEQGVVAGPGGERTVHHAHDEDGVEVEPGEQSDRSDEHPGSEREVWGANVSSSTSTAWRKAARSGLAQPVQDRQPIGGGADGGERFLFLGGPRIRGGRGARGRRRRRWSASSTIRPTCRR